MMNYQFIADLENDLRKRFPNYPAEPTLTPDRCPAGMKGDFALNCFRLARFCGGPAAAAEAVAGFLRGHADVEAVEVVRRSSTSRCVPPRFAAIRWRTSEHCSTPPGWRSPPGAGF